MVLHPALNLTCSSAVFFSLRFQLIQYYFQKDFAGVANEINGVIILTWLKIVLFRKHDNEQLSPWCKPLAILLDHVADDGESMDHDFSPVPSC